MMSGSIARIRTCRSGRYGEARSMPGNTRRRTARPCQPERPGMHVRGARGARYRGSGQEARLASPGRVSTMPEQAGAAARSAFGSPGELLHGQRLARQVVGDVELRSSRNDLADSEPVQQLEQTLAVGFILARRGHGGLASGEFALDGLIAALPSRCTGVEPHPAFRNTHAERRQEPVAAQVPIDLGWRAFPLVAPVVVELDCDELALHKERKLAAPRKTASSVP